MGRFIAARRPPPEAYACTQAAAFVVNLRRAFENTPQVTLLNYLHQVTLADA